MKSPFPGMDPYIEQAGLFEDFHYSLIGDLAKALAIAVPDRYSVRKAERPYIVMSEDDGRQSRHAFVPDVGISKTSSPNNGSASVAVLEPETVVEDKSIMMQALVTEEHREVFIEIYLREPNRELVTCIEVLSPTNKRRGNEGWDLYQRKRRSMLHGNVNFVEIDLLRGGERMPMADAWPNSPYAFLVANRESAPACRVWPAHFTKRLPNLPIPLLKPDADIVLPMQKFVDDIYEQFRYYRDLDYKQPLNPPLTADESAWLAARLATLSR